MKTPKHCEFITFYQRQRNEAVKKLLKIGKVFINFWSTDCDGCSSQGSKQINSVQELIDFEIGFQESLEWADGPMGWYFCEEQDRMEQECGGSWGNY
jgi:hypothetical protein